MRAFHLLPQVSSGTPTKNLHPRQNLGTKQGSYKPKAIRIPALLSLLFLFIICFTWLEILMKRTIKPSKYYETHGISDGLKVKKRQALSANQCPASNVNAQNLASLQSKHSELCSSYTTVFKPETTNLSPAMQSRFDSWLAAYSSMEALSELAESCGSSLSSSSALSSLLDSLITTSAAKIGTSSQTPASSQSSTNKDPVTSGTLGSAQRVTGTSLVTSDTASPTSAASLAGVTTSDSGQTSSIQLSSVAGSGSNTADSSSIPDSASVGPALVSAQNGDANQAETSTNVAAQSSNSLSLNTSDTEFTGVSTPTSFTLTPTATMYVEYDFSSTPSSDFSTLVTVTTSQTSSNDLIVTSEVPTNTTPSELSAITELPVDNFTICQDVGQSCDYCDASICTCAAALSNALRERDTVTTVQYDDATAALVENLQCLPDRCACQQDPNDSTNYVCGSSVNTCNDICTGPFTPEGVPCSCETADCYCLNSVCTINSTETTTAVDTGCVPGESCDYCGAGMCYCISNQEYSWGDYITTRDINTYCLVDDCHCVFDENSQAWQCGETNLCESSATTTNALEATPTPTATDSMTCTLGESCDWCGADYCGCTNATSIQPQCEVDMCRCTYDLEFSSWECSDACLYCTEEACDTTGGSNTTTPTGTITSALSTATSAECTPGESCQSCEAEKCLCSPGVATYYAGLRARDMECRVNECFCSYVEEMSTWSCGDVNYCTATSSANSTIEPTSTTYTDSSVTTSDAGTITSAPCIPGEYCDSCDAGICSCSSYPTIGASCAVDTCSCSLQSSTWECNTHNLCSATATTSSVEAYTTDLSCNPTYAICFGCDPDNEEAACQCNADFSCVPAPCPDCTFSEDGKTMSCPSNCTVTNNGMIKRRESPPRFLNEPWFRAMHHANDIHGFNAHEKMIRRESWGMMDKRQGIEILTGDYQTPIRDAWNYLLWTSPLTVRRTSSSYVTTTVAATFTLDVFEGGSTSWPSLTSTPPLTTQPKEPACIPATLIQPLLAGQAKRDGSASMTKSIKPYVTRESTTVVVKIRDNYLEVTSNIPTITQGVDQSATEPGVLQALSSQTVTVESVAPDGSTQTLSVVVVRPGATLEGVPDATLQRLGSPTETGSSIVDISNGDDGDDDENSAGRGSDGDSSDGQSTKSNPADSHIQKLTDKQRVVNLPYTSGSYFGSMYAPALTAIFIKILFEPMLGALKGMEPFERLHRSEGATADASLCSQYLSSSLSWDTINSIWTGSSVPLWMTIMYLIVAISAPLASASMTIRPMDECMVSGVWKLCSPAWIIDVNFLRTLQALLIVCIILTLFLLWSSWTYHARVPTNPTSIVSVAVLLNYEPLRQDLQAVDPEATADELERALEEYHFWLMPHAPSRGASRYGFVHSQNANDNTPIAPKLPTFLAKFENRYNRLRPHLYARHSIRLADWVHIFTTMALLVLLVTYRANTRNDAFNYFFASYSFWPKLILVALATVIDMQWKSLEREVRITEPYRRLHLGNARPENTILRSLNGTCWSTLPRACKDLFRFSHMWFEALVSVTAIISDINIIAVSGVLMSFSTTRTVYQWSSITALTTTSIMSLVLLVVVFWWRRTEAISTMPRAPETLAAVMSYLCISRMAMDFANMGLEGLEKEERDRIIVEMDRRYRFGRMLGEDGKVRYCVDYDDGEETSDGDSRNERESWVREKMARPVPVRLDT